MVLLQMLHGADIARNSLPNMLKLPKLWKLTTPQ